MGKFLRLVEKFLERLWKGFLNGSWGWILIWMFIPACAGNKKPDRLVKNMVLTSLHFRRPESIGASQTAEPGDEDYYSNPRPNLKWDCQPIPELFWEVDLAAIRGCFWAMKNSDFHYLASFRLRREIEPYLELVDSDDDVPVCLENLLAKIPVPREIFFQSVEGNGSLGCYNARIPLAEEELLGISNALNHQVVQVSLPPEKIPSHDEEMVQYLATWVLLSFWDNAERGLVGSRIVPEGICQKCVGEKNFLREGDPVPLTWPGPNSDLPALGKD